MLYFNIAEQLLTFNHLYNFLSNLDIRFQKESYEWYPNCLSSFMFYICQIVSVWRD